MVFKQKANYTFCLTERLCFLFLALNYVASVRKRRQVFNAASTFLQSVHLQGAEQRGSRPAGPPGETSLDDRAHNCPVIVWNKLMR